MRKPLLVLFCLVPIGAALWWFNRDSRGGQAAQSGDRASAPNVSGAGASGTNGAGPQVPQAGSERVDAARVDTPGAAEKPAPSPTDPRLVEQAEWMEAYGLASDEELGQLIEKIGSVVAQERERLFADPDLASRIETMWVDIELDESQVEARYPRPGMVSVAKLVERDKPSSKAQFQVLFLTSDEAPDLAYAQRQIAFFHSRLGKNP